MRMAGCFCTFHHNVLASSAMRVYSRRRATAASSRVISRSFLTCHVLSSSHRMQLHTASFCSSLSRTAAGSSARCRLMAGAGDASGVGVGACAAMC